MRKRFELPLSCVSLIEVIPLVTLRAPRNYEWSELKTASRTRKKQVDDKRKYDRYLKENAALKNSIKFLFYLF